MSDVLFRTGRKLWCFRQLQQKISTVPDKKNPEESNEMHEGAAESPSNKCDTHQNVEGSGNDSRLSGLGQNIVGGGSIADPLFDQSDKLSDIFFTPFFAGKSFSEVHCTIVTQSPLARFTGTNSSTIRVVETVHGCWWSTVLAVLFFRKLQQAHTPFFLHYPEPRQFTLIGIGQWTSEPRTLNALTIISRWVRSRHNFTGSSCLATKFLRVCLEMKPIS